MARNYQTNLQFGLPLSRESIDALLAFTSGSLVHLHFVINGEEIQLKHKQTSLEHPLQGTTVDIFNENHLKIQLLPTDDTSNVGYHLFVFKYHEPNQHPEVITSKVVLAFIRPSQTSSVRDRMLYSSCVNVLGRSIRELISPLVIAKRVEVDQCDKLTVGHVASALYPQLIMLNSGDKPRYINTDSNGPKFAKPAPPTGRRGSRRLIR